MTTKRKKSNSTNSDIKRQKRTIKSENIKDLLNIILPVADKINNININNNYEKNLDRFDYIKSGYDILYLNNYNSKVEKILELFTDDLKSSNSDMSISGSKINYDDNLNLTLIKAFFILVDNASDTSFLNLKIKKSKSSSPMIQGGSTLDFNPNDNIKEYLENQYIFDSNHDFKNLLKKNYKEVLYSQTDVKVNKNPILQSFYKLEDRQIFQEVLKQNNELVDKIFYFSIFNLVKPNVKHPDIIGTTLIKDKDQLDKIKNNIIELYNDVLNATYIKFILDVKINIGNLNKLKEYGQKLVSINVLDNPQSLILEKNNFEKIKNTFHNYVNVNKIITLEDSFDSASIAKADAYQSFNNQIGSDNINLFAYISNLIFSDDDYTNLGNLTNNKNLFKAFNETNRKLFNAVYYKEKSKNSIRTAFLFKNTRVFQSIISGLRLKEFIIIERDTDINNYVYKQVDNFSSNPNNRFYAIELFDFKNFNSNPNISGNIKKYIYKFNNIQNYLTEIPKSPMKANQLVLIVYIIKCLMTSSTISNDIKKTASRLLLDLKKAGDAAKILFSYFYNYLKDNNISNPSYIPSSIANLQSKLIIPNQLLFSGNDKLTVLNAILRDKHSVVFSDTANYAFCLFSNNNDYTFKNFLNFINIYFNPKFINKLNIFQTIDTDISIATTIDNNKIINNIFRNIPNEVIYFNVNNIKSSDTIITSIKNYLIHELNNLFSLFNSNTGVFHTSIKRFLDLIIPISSKFDQFKNQILALTDTDAIIRNIDYDINYFHNYFDETSKIIDKLYNIDKRINQSQISITNINRYSAKIKEEFYNLQITKFKQLIILYKQIQYLETQSSITSFNLILNNYIKLILRKYLENNFTNINKKVLDNENIQFFINKVLFYRVSVGSSNLALKELLEGITIAYFKIIMDSFNDIIIAIISIIETTNEDLSDVNVIKPLFISITHLFKIFELFLIYDKNSTSSIDNITNIIYNIQKYIFQLLTYKLSDKKKGSLSISNLLEDPKIFINETIGTKYNFKSYHDFQSSKVGPKVSSITHNLLVSMNYINYIILFNDFYKNFDKLSDITILGVKINKIDYFILDIKRLYNFSFINIYTSEIKDTLNILFDSIKDNIKEITDKNIALLTSSKDEEKRDFLQAVSTDVIASVDTAKRTIEEYKENITDKTIDDELYKALTFDFNSNSKGIFFEYKNKYPAIIDNAKFKEVLNSIKLMNKIDITKIDKSELKKFILIYDYLVQPKTRTVQVINTNKPGLISYFGQLKDRLLGLININTFRRFTRIT